jgi:hypothetical protein
VLPPSPLPLLQAMGSGMTYSTAEGKGTNMPCA